MRAAMTFRESIESKMICIEAFGTACDTNKHALEDDPDSRSCIDILEVTLVQLV
jgi:hypothetical protein